jgi:hypothetical protein
MEANGSLPDDPQQSSTSARSLSTTRRNGGVLGWNILMEATESWISSRHGKDIDEATGRHLEELEMVFGELRDR